MEFSGFIGPAYQTQSLNASAEDLINLYLETQESPGASPRRVLYGTPGLSAPIMTLVDSPHRAALSQDGRSFAIAGGTLFETTSGAGVSLGLVANDGKPATMHSNGQGGHQIFIVSGGQGYILDLNTTVLSPIVASGFPNGSALMGAFMDGYFVVATSGAIQISKLEDGTTWSASDKQARSIATDNIVGILTTHRELWVMGSLTSEPWYNSGATFPFAPISGVLVDQGLAAPASLTRFDNSIVWIAQNRDGDRQVMTISQLSPLRMSTHAVEASLRACPSLSDFVAFAYQEEGHAFYVLTSALNNLTWVYDASEQTWHRRAYQNPLTGQGEAIRAITHVVVGGAHWVGDRATGKIFQQALGIYTDNGAPIRAVRRAPHLAQEQTRMVYDLLQIEAETGVGLQSGQGSTPQLMLRYSNDGGHLWSNEITASLGAVGQDGARAMFWRLGSGRNRVFEVSCSDPIKRAWQAAALRIRPGAD